MGIIPKFASFDWVSRLARTPTEPPIAREFSELMAVKVQIRSRRFQFSGTNFAKPCDHDIIGTIWTKPSQVLLNVLDSARGNFDILSRQTQDSSACIRGIENSATDRSASAEKLSDLTHIWRSAREPRQKEFFRSRQRSNGSANVDSRER